MGVPVQAQTERTTAPLREAARLSDEQLVDRALAGDRAGFETLVERHRAGLIHHLMRQTGQRELAHDLAQEVFLKVYTALPRFDPKYRFTTWLYRIATNRAIDLMRRKQLPVCSLDEDDGGRRIALANDAPGPDAMLRYTELQRRIEDAIGELPEDHRRLLSLRNERHFRYDEISRITGLPIGTVKNRIFRARAHLRELLGDLLDGLEAGAT